MSILKDLYIIGAGDAGRELVDLIERINMVQYEWNIVGFVDSDIEKHGRVYEDIPVVGDVDLLNFVESEVYAVCSITNGVIKKRVLSQIHNPLVTFASLIDPSVLFCRGSSCGVGCIICAGTILAMDATIGNHVHINFNCSIGHDALISDYCSVFPGVNVSGRVKIGESTVVGTGSKIIQGKTIASHVMIGAGAVVVRDIMESGTYVGVPAKKIIK